MWKMSSDKSGQTRERDSFRPSGHKNVSSRVFSDHNKVQVNVLMTLNHIYIVRKLRRFWFSSSLTKFQTHFQVTETTVSTSGHHLN